MDDRLALLEQQLREAQRLHENERRLREEEQRLRENEQRLREEEQQRRQHSEALIEPTDLPTFLLNCHHMSEAINVVTDPTLTTQGGTAPATRRYYPSRIVPWDNFLDKQSETWNLVSQHSSFMAKKQFPSSHQLDYVLKRVSPITAEMDLRYYERDTVENQVQEMMNSIYANDRLRQELGLAGSVTFESHTNLGASQHERSSAGAAQSSHDTDVPGDEEQPPRKKKRKDPEDGAPISRGQADRFCVYRRGNDEDIPTIAIEYKAPHKLTIEEIATGLTGEIHPARDIINKDEDSSEFYSKRLVTVIITQLFSYMVGKGVQYGYVCTGEAFIFLYVPEDSLIAQYSLSVPNRDVQTDQEESLYLTAVAQVVAFTLRALASPPPSQIWHDNVADIGVWPVEYADVLAQTPPSKRLKGKQPSAYRGKKGVLPLFRMTLRSCRPIEKQAVHRSRTPTPPGSPSPASNQPIAHRKKPGPLPTQQEGQQQHGSQGGRGDSDKQGKGKQSIPIADRPYCSHKCLLGLRDGGPLDPACPNFDDHQGKEIPSQDILTRVRKQLATDRGPDADCRPLYKAGSYGALFKIRLSSHGFTFVAKGATSKNRATLSHELTIYRKLRAIQGVHVPACLGIVELEPKYPYYYNFGRYTHMLLLSWGGKSIATKSVVEGVHPSISNMVASSLQEIHQQCVLHMDAEPRNILWNEACQSPMIVDFGRALVRDPLSSVVSTNTLMGKKRPRDAKGNDSFADELQTVRHSVDHLVWAVRNTTTQNRSWR